MADEKNLAIVPPAGALERPDWLADDDVSGTDHITKDDIVIPRLAIAQGTSDQIKEDNAKYIEGLKLYHMFNSLTGKLFMRGPLEFAIIRGDRPRYIEFRPRSEGGGVIDMNVPANDPRTQFTKDEEGNSVPPRATKFYDYVIVLLPLDQKNPRSSIIGLSLKSTGLKVAKQLNMMIQERNAPIYAGKYRVVSGPEKNAKGEYGQYFITNAGFVSRDEGAVLKELYEAFKDKQIVHDRDETPEEDVAFPYGANAKQPEM